MGGAATRIRPGRAAAAGHDPPARGGAAARLQLSASQVRYGHEGSELLHVRVRPLYPQYTATPTGTVVVTAGTRALCVRTLHRGAAACTLTSAELARGVHYLRVTYRGSPRYRPATSAQVRLRVTG